MVRLVKSKHLQKWWKSKGKKNSEHIKFFSSALRNNKLEIQVEFYITLCGYKKFHFPLILIACLTYVSGKSCSFFFGGSLKFYNYFSCIIVFSSRFSSKWGVLSTFTGLVSRPNQVKHCASFHCNFATHPGWHKILFSDKNNNIKKQSNERNNAWITP